VAIQSHKLGKNWIASSQGLLAMTGAMDADQLKIITG
jgi:hypothetical protein